MPAAIASNGTTDLFASHREVAWHGLGTVFQHEVTDYREMLDLSGLSGWNLHMEDAPLPDGVSHFLTPTRNVIGTIGDDTVVFGTTGSRYEIVQNEQAFAFLQSLSDGARWETAGAIKDGRTVFGSIALDRETVLDPNGVADVVKSFLLVHARHDGSGGVAGGRTAVRVVCQNTLDMALGSISQKFNFRHTATVEQRMAQGAEEWRNTNLYFDEFEKEAQALYAQKVTDNEFFGIVSDIFPKPEENVKGAMTKWETNFSKFAQAWNGRPNEGIKGTGWGALNALTEANQWGRKAQNTKNGQENFLAAGAGFDGPTTAFRANALARVRALV